MNNQFEIKLKKCYNYIGGYYMKYEFVKVDSDTTVLKYKDKEFKFIKDISLMVRLQSVNFNARNNMIIDLAKKGLTTDNLIIKRVENGKKYEDQTSVRAMENNYLIKETLDLFNEICEKYTKMDLQELMNDIGITEEEESKVFGAKLKEVILGNNSPSEA
jgi:hypothetical protein